MNSGHRFTVGQWIGTFIFLLSTGIPGLWLAGFHGGTSLSIIAWVFVAMVGGTIGGALLDPKHRLAGAAGGFVAGPMGLLSLYFYARNRDRLYRAEAVLVQLIASLPGLGVYFMLRLLTDAIFPPRKTKHPRQDDDEVEEEQRPRRRRHGDEADADDEDDEPRGKRRPRDDDDEPRPKPRRN